MSGKKQLLKLLIDQKKTLEEALDASKASIWQHKQLKRFLRNLENISPLLYLTSLSVGDVISFLMEESYLQRIDFITPRSETLFIWRTVHEYNLMIALRPKGYYSHLSAMYFHGLVDKEPATIYFNYEQPVRLVSGALEQGRIDNAFKKNQRLTNARTILAGKELWLLNGKQTGNYGTMLIKTRFGLEVPVTDLERTLIDITVRPAYSGGVNNVLKAYRLAKPKISIAKMVSTLHALNYVYPYHQSIGFYIDKSGVYDPSACQEFLNFAPLLYNFYLDYKMTNPAYSEKWKIYYPHDLG